MSQVSHGSANGRSAIAFGLMMAMVLLQVVLGIVTVRYAAFWPIAIMHQIGAIVLMVLALRARFRALYPESQSLR
ncbi:MAG: COX15/CtaA family protein [Paracoccaceae bacterium]